MSIRILLTCLFLSLLCTPDLAQSKFLADNYWVEHYTTKEGLPENAVIDITQDKKGYIWMVTNYHLVRYDGYEFKTFDPRKQFPKLYFILTTGLLESTDGKIWVTTANNGLLCFDTQSQQFKHLSIFEGQNINFASRFRDLQEDKDGTIWLSRHDGLARVIKTGGQLSLEPVNNSCPDSLLNTLDRIIKRHPSTVNITKVKNFEHRTKIIKIKKKSNLLIINMGEVSNRKPVDFGWVENIQGDTIWKFDESKAFLVGGTNRNKLALEVLTLKPGTYKVSYISDFWHSWERWIFFQPKKHHWWGIQMIELPKPILDSLVLSIQKLHKILPNRPKALRIVDLFKDSKNRLWALTDTSLERIDKLNGQSIRLLKKISLPRNFGIMTNLIELRPNQLMLQGTIYDKKQNIFISTNLTLNLITNKVELYQNELLQNDWFLGFGKNFLRDKHKTFWIALRNNGLYYSSNNGSVISKFKKIELKGLRYKDVWSVFEDRAGHIWVGTELSGLFKIRTKKTAGKYISLNKDGKDTLKFIQIKEDDHRNLWLHAKNKGIFQINHNLKASTFYPEKKGENDEPYFVNNKLNHLIICDNQQVKKYNHKKKQFEPFPVKIPDSLKLIAIDQKGNHWVIHRHRIEAYPVCYILEKDKITRLNFDKTNSTNIGYMNFSIGAHENIWFCPAFLGAHLYRLNDKPKKLVLMKKYLSLGIDVWDVYEDKKGMIWMATYDYGLILLNPKTNTFKSFKREDGMPSNQVYKLIPLKTEMWVLTPNGSIFINLEKGTIRLNKELNDYLQQKNIGNLRDYTYNNRVIATSNGKIALPVPNGLCILDPKGFRTDSTTPILNLTNLKIADKNIHPDEVIHHKKSFKLKHKQNDINIEYIGIHYDKATQNQYAYRLNGANKTWVNAGKERIARYTNLSPGYYEFHLKAANADGVWSAGKKMLSFTILPPWWRTWWFITLCALSVMGAAYALYLYRINQLQKAFAFQQKALTSEMKALRAQMNPHFIFNSLNSINAFIITNKSAQAAQQLTQFSNLMRQILDHSSKDVISLEQEIEFLENYLQIEAVRMDNKLNYTIQVAPEIDTFETEIPSMVLQPYLENAIWHGLSMRKEGGKISLTISKPNDTLLLCIEDNGIGRAKAATLRKGQHHSKGMQITAERLALYAEKYHKQVAVQIIDLLDADEALGTRVEIEIGPKN